LYRSYRKDWHKQGEFTYDCHTRNDNNQYNYTTSENIKELPEDAVPIEAMDTEEGWRMSGQLILMKSTKTGTRKETFQEYIRSQESFISQDYTQIEFLSTPTFQINKKIPHSNGWRSNTNERINRLRIC
jgi:hypothetical protein